MASLLQKIDRRSYTPLSKEQILKASSTANQAQEALCPLFEQFPTLFCKQSIKPENQGSKPLENPIDAIITGNHQPKQFKIFDRPSMKKMVVPSSPFTKSSLAKTPLDRSWFYLDEADRIQGPFTSIEMDNWFDHGFFFNELLVKFEDQGDYKKLIDLLGVEETIPNETQTGTSPDKPLKGFTRSNNPSLPTGDKGQSSSKPSANLQELAKTETLEQSTKNNNKNSLIVPKELGIRPKVSDSSKSPKRGAETTQGGNSSRRSKSGRSELDEEDDEDDDDEDEDEFTDEDQEEDGEEDEDDENYQPIERTTSLGLQLMQNGAFVAAKPAKKKAQLAIDKSTEEIECPGILPEGFDGQFDGAEIFGVGLGSPEEVKSSKRAITVTKDSKKDRDDDMDHNFILKMIDAPSPHMRNDTSQYEITVSKPKEENLSQGGILAKNQFASNSCVFSDRATTAMASQQNMSREESKRHLQNLQNQGIDDEDEEESDDDDEDGKGDLNGGIGSTTNIKMRTKTITNPDGTTTTIQVPKKKRRRRRKRKNKTATDAAKAEQAAVSTNNEKTLNSAENSQNEDSEKKKKIASKPISEEDGEQSKEDGYNNQDGANKNSSGKKKRRRRRRKNKNKDGQNEGGDKNGDDDSQVASQVLRDQIPKSKNRLLVPEGSSPGKSQPSSCNSLKDFKKNNKKDFLNNNNKKSSRKDTLTKGSFLEDEFEEEPRMEKVYEPKAPTSFDKFGNYLQAHGKEAQKPLIIQRMIEKEKRREMKQQRKQAWQNLINEVNQSTGSESTQDSQTVSNLSMESGAHYYRTISGPSAFKSYDANPYTKTQSGPSAFKDFDKKNKLMPTRFKTEANEKKQLEFQQQMQQYQGFQGGSNGYQQIGSNGSNPKMMAGGGGYGSNGSQFQMQKPQQQFQGFQGYQQMSPGNLQINKELSNTQFDNPGDFFRFSPTNKAYRNSPNNNNPSNFQPNNASNNSGQNMNMIYGQHPMGSNNSAGSNNYGNPNPKPFQFNSFQQQQQQQQQQQNPNISLDNGFLSSNSGSNQSNNGNITANNNNLGPNYNKNLLGGSNGSSGNINGFNSSNANNGNSNYNFQYGSYPMNNGRVGSNGGANQFIGSNGSNQKMSGPFVDRSDIQPFGSDYAQFQKTSETFFNE